MRSKASGFSKLRPIEMPSLVYKLQKVEDNLVTCKN